MVVGMNMGVNQALASGQSSSIQKNGNSNTVNNAEKAEAISKVDDIKKQIEAGTYKIKLEESAKAMADTLI